LASQQGQCCHGDDDDGDCGSGGDGQGLFRMCTEHFSLSNTEKLHIFIVDHYTF